MEELENGAASPATESAPVTEAPVVETPAAPKTIDQTMEETWAKMHPEERVNRDNGKFVSKTPAEAAPTEAAPAEETTDQSPQEEQGTATPSTDAPNAWSAEEKALWAKVPPEAQAIIARRETEAHRTISQQGQQIATFRPISEVIERHRETFQRNGVNEQEGLARLLAANDALDKDPSAAIAWLAKSYGVDLAKLASGQPAQEAVDPKIAQLEAQVRQLTQNLSARETTERQSRELTLAQTIDEFATRKDIQPYFADLEAEIMAQIPGVRASEPNLAPEKVLEKAFEKAKWASPTVRERILQDQRKADEDKRKAEQAKQVAEAKKHQALNSKSGKGASPVSGTWEDTMRQRLNEVMPG